MLYDLNVPWTPTTSPQELQRTLTFLTTLGYNTLALNHQLSLPLPSQLTNPIPQPLPFAPPPSTTLLTRLTLTYSDPTTNHRLRDLQPLYSLLALRPTNKDAFEKACLSVQEASLISLDLSTRFQFFFKPKTVMAAINRGIRFEICYSQCVSGDGNGRRNFISNFMNLVRATKGRGLVISSEARGVLGCRGPADVGNLLGVWGLARERAVEAMGVNCRAVVVNEGLRRTSFRGVVDVIDGGEPYVAPEGKGKGKGKRKLDEVEEVPKLSKRAKARLRKEKTKEMEEAPSPGQSSAPAIPSSSSKPEPETGPEPDVTSRSTIKSTSNG